MKKAGEIAIADDLSVFTARRSARDQALAIGFSKKDAEELAIVASELASNIVKYGVSGTMRFEATTHPVHGPGISITAADKGQPFRDWTMALRDGHDDAGPIDPMRLLKRRGIGTGLGAVVRLTDSFDVHPDKDGKKLCAVRYVKRPRTR